MRVHDVTTLMPDQIELYEKARLIWRRAYAPYTGYNVGAALRSSTGRIYLGCNIEESSFSRVIHAEEAATTQGYLREGSRFRISEIAIYADAPSASPCGACRQVLAEFAEEAAVIFPWRGRVIVRGLNKLLSYTFELSRRE